MRLTPHNRDNYRFIAIGIILAIAIVSGVSAFIQGRGTGRAIHTQLSERSQSIAAALGYQQISQLSGTAGDAESATYKDLKIQLAAVKLANPDARSVYLMGSHGGSHLFFYVDSEKSTSSQYSSAGEAYNDGTAADAAMFITGKPVVEGPATDEYGTFISGLAPIFQPGTGKVIAVLGIDVDASKYLRDVLTSAMLSAITGVAIIIIVIFFESLRRRNLQLLALRSELVSVASHELRNPITGIRWASDSLRKMISDEQAIRMANAIYNSAVNLQSTTDDILELTHAMNRRSISIAPVDMTALLNEVISVQSLSAQQKGINLVLDASLPAQLMVDCDADQIKRALHNVISNAVKYGREHTTVTVAYKQEEGMHEILVIDQGIGIPEMEQAKVWRGFYRASNAKSSGIPGTGLGLYLVKAVFDQHGGRVSFSSVQNQGTTFVLALPVHRR